MMFLKSFSSTSESRAAQSSAQIAAQTAEDRERDWTPDPAVGSFESFGRSGLEIGGLHRDQHWVGAWGGRC